MTLEKKPSFLKDIATLFKVRLGFFVVLSAVLGWFMGVETIDIKSMMLLATGGYLLTGASNGLNQIIERDTDAIMSRTKNRPLPTGRMSVKTALFLSISAAVVGLFCLSLLNYISAILGVVSLILVRIFLYPLKISYYAVRFCRSHSRSTSSYDWICCCNGGAGNRALRFIRSPIYVAIPSLLGDRMARTRRLRKGELQDAAL